MFVAKYNASGNDFVILHDFAKKDRSTLAQKLCDRQKGIGADGLIVLVAHDTYDFEWQFYNSDGSEANMCGNGSRACAHYAYTHNLAPQSMQFLTKAGVITAQVKEHNIVKSTLTKPIIIDKAIDAFDKKWYLIDTGVPHLVTFDASMDDFDLSQARALRQQYNANVNIAKVHDTHIDVRTYERGVEDETLACGTGMAACYYQALQEGKVTANDTTVIPTGKERLTLAFDGQTITLEGAVTNTFNAEYLAYD